MGFDISVILKIGLHPETGVPFVWSNETPDRLPFNPADFVVPAEHRHVLRGRGPIFHAYTERFNREDRYEVGAAEFLEDFPTWEEVKNHDRYYDEWTEDDHNKFKAAIEWFAAASYVYNLEWSY